MAMNVHSLKPVVAATLIGGFPAGVMVGTARQVQKTIGAPGSLVHVLSNDKLVDKNKVIKEQSKESIKDTLKLVGLSVGTGAVASLAGVIAGKPQKVADASKVKKLSGLVGNKIQSTSKEICAVVRKIPLILDSIKLGEKSVKDMIKSTEVFKKFSALPAPAKIGIEAGVAALALMAPFAALISAEKAGYIEGKNEVK